MSSILSLALAFCLLPVALSANELRKVGDGPLGPFVEAPDEQVFVNVLGLLYGTPTVGYEQMVGRQNSFTGQVGLRSQGASDFNVTYLGLVGSYRWWLGNHAKIQGVYVGPMASASLVNASYDVINPVGVVHRDYQNTSILGVGGEGGYQWVLPSRITFGVGLNAAYYFGSLTLGPGTPSIPFGGFGMGLNGTVGYAF